MGNRKKYGLNFLLIAGFTAGVLWFCLKDNLTAVMGMMSQIQILWLILTVLLLILYQGSIGWVLTRITRGTQPRYRLTQGVLNTVIAGFFHGITPSASGGQFAQVYVFRKQGVGLSEAAGILWLEFIVYQAVMLLVTLALILLRLPYFYSRYSQFFALVLIGFVLNSAVIVGLWALARYPRFYTWVSTTGLNLAVRVHLIHDREGAMVRLQEQLNRFEAETRQFSRKKKLLVQLVPGNIVRLVQYYSVPVFCARTLGIALDLPMVLDMITLASFVATVNAFIPIPGASGGTEATFVLMFSTILGTLSATSVMLLWRTATYVLPMAAGALSFLWVRGRKQV